MVKTHVLDLLYQKDAGVLNYSPYPLDPFLGFTPLALAAYYTLSPTWQVLFFLSLPAFLDIVPCLHLQILFHTGKRIVKCNSEFPASSYHCFSRSYAIYDSSVKSSQCRISLGDGWNNLFKGLRRRTVNSICTRGYNASSCDFIMRNKSQIRGKMVGSRKLGHPFLLPL